MLEVRDLEIRYGSVVAVDGISLDVKEGETVCLIGPNGVGKTTTLLSIAGLVRPASGKIKFFERHLVHLRPEKIVRLGIGLVPEGRWILGEMTVLDNLFMGAFRPHAYRATLARDIERG